MKRDYPDRPFVGVGTVVLKDDCVVLIKRGKAPRKGQWSIPGGAQSLGETVADAARRETMEETGLDIELLGLLDVIDYVDRDDAGEVRHHYTLIDLYAEAKSENARPGDDVTEVAWVHRDDLDQYGLWAETERIIRLAFAKRDGTAP